MTDHPRNRPHDVEYTTPSGYYKQGPHGRMFYWTGLSWRKSTKTLDQVIKELPRTLKRKNTKYAS